MADPARTLTDADVDAIAERVAALLLRGRARTLPPIEDKRDTIPAPSLTDRERMRAKLRRYGL